MINKEYAKKVYNGLVKRGYTSEDLGDEAKFVERMGKETNRRYLYDLVNKRGDANLGTFEGFEKRMGVTSKPEAGGIVGPMPFDAGIPSTPQTQSAQQPISNFGEGVAQGADALYQGGKNAVAEYSNIMTGSQRDAQLGLDILSARSEGVIPEFDVNSELDAYNKSEYEKRLKDIEDRRAAATSTTAGRWTQFAIDLISGREEDNLRKENLSVADYLHRKRAFEAIEQALKDSAGDVEKAKKLLAERAKIESWGDAKGREAREAMSQHRPTEGAAWVGEMIPQMAGTAAGLAASLHPATRPLAGVLGKSNLLGLTISSMGSQMAEARNDGASEGDVFKAGALNAAVEAGSEYVPFSRYFGRLVKNTGDVIGRVVGESLEHSPRAKKELQDLLKKGSKELGKLFTGKNAMEFAKDITGEAASEFVAEFGNALIPLIYSNPELYPTLLQAVENGWEGAKGGLFMGTFLGSGSKLASYYAHDKRRKQQGFVVLAETSDGDVVEYAGKDENGNAVVIDGNGEQLTIDSDELGEAVRVSYNEFKTGERGAFRDRMEESFNDGKSAQTKEDKEYIGLSYEYALRRLEELSGLSAEGIKNGFPNAVAVYEAADDAVKANNIEYAKALNDYANAWARLEGSNNAIEEVVEQQSAASDAEVDALSDNGVMRPATLRSGEKVFVIGGNIAVDNNGGIVYEESDAQIVVNVNGERKVVGIAEIVAVGETVNSEEEKISRRGRIESDINNKHNSDINGWKELIPGESYNVLFDGTPFELMVVGRNENGELLISGDGGKSTESISEADFQNSIREYELRQITVAELNERFAGKLKVLNAMLANIRSEGNEDKAAANFSEVENMVAELDGELPDGYRVVAENGNYVIADALVSANENEASAEGEKGLNGEKGSEGEKVDEESVPAEAAVPVGPEKVASEETAALSPAEQRKQKRAEVAKRIPTEGKKRLWTKAKPEDVAEYISLLESDPAKQAAMVDGYLAEIAEKLSPIEAAELNEDVEFWNGVKGLLGVETENVARENNDVSKTEGVEAEVVERTENVSAPAVEDVRATNEMQPAEEQSGEANEMVEEAAAESDISEDNIMLSEEEAENLIAQMKYTAESARELELTPEAWEEEFGEEGVMESPIGAVKMGENQYFKLLKKKRAGYFGMIKPTLTNPDVVLEEYDPKDGAERQTKYLFVKTFVKADGSRYVHFESVTVLKETLEVSISSHEVNEDALKRKMQQCKLLHLNSKFLNSEGRLIEPLEEGSDLVPTPNSVSSESKDTPQVSNEQENEQKSGEIGNTGVNESVPDNAESVSESAESVPEATKKTEESSEKDIVDELRERNENAKEREQRAGFPPRPSDYVDAIIKEDATAAKEWEDKFNVYLQKLGVADLPDIDGTISNMQGLKKSIKAGNPKGYKENPNYKAFDYIEKALKKRRKQIESAADSAGGAEAESATGGEVGGTATISQESEQVGEQDAGPVNMETLQLNMSKEDFNALLNSGDEAAISEYLAELDDALRMDENSPFAGEMALRDEYKNAVQQYGKENIPAEVMDDLTRRMMPYADLSRAIYNRKYALEDKLRELESAAEKATAAKEKEIKVENKNTAFGGFLADKTDLGASTAEKALNKKYNFDGKVMTVAEFVENAVANGDAKLSTIEEPKYKGASRAAWNRMDAKQQEEDAKKVKESGTKTVYTVNDHDLGKTAYDYAKFLLDNKEQIRENVERIIKSLIEADVSGGTEGDLGSASQAESVKEYTFEELEDFAKSLGLTKDWSELSTEDRKHVLRVYNTEQIRGNIKRKIKSLIEPYGLRHSRKPYYKAYPDVLQLEYQWIDFAVSNDIKAGREKDVLRIYSEVKQEYPMHSDGYIVADLLEKRYKQAIKKAQKGELQRGSLSLDTENPAFEAATKNTVEAVKKTGVEVEEATPEMVQAIIKGEAKGLTADELHELRGVVARGLADAEVKIVNCGKNPFDIKQKTVDLKREALNYAEKNGIIGTMSNEETNGKGEIRISKKSIGKFVDDSASDKSVDKDVHLSVLPQIRDVIASSIEAEVHPDYIKTDKGRSRESRYNKNVLIHRCYGAVNVDGKVYRVKITLKEDITNKHTKAYSYEVTNIELLEGTDENAVTVLSQQDSSITGAKLLKGVEKSYDKGTRLLSASENAPEFMKVYHGSGAKFDKFDHTFMGTGEGGRVAGSGIYVTTNKEVGISYAEFVGRNRDKERYLYSVEIPDDNGSNYIDLDGKVSDSLKSKVKEKVLEFLFNGEDADYWKRNKRIIEQEWEAVEEGDAIGYTLRETMEELIGDSEIVSDIFSSLGFVGFKTNEDTPSGTTYVIFNENDAQIIDRVEFLRTSDGTVYGWAVNGKIFLTPEGMNPNTPAHEYTHLWASMIEKNNPKLWSRIVEVMKESPTWNEVLLDEAYRDIHNNDSRMASEVLSRLSGEENYRRAMELAEREIKDADGIIEKAKKIALWGRIKQALADFWASVKGVFGFKDKAPWTEFVDMALGDLYAGVNPNAVGSPLERMFVGERGASNLDRAEEASLRLDNLNVAREMEEAGKGAKAIKLATGWERGADGKWRYEVMDDFAFDMSGNVDYGKRKPESLKEYNRYKELLHKKNALAFEGEELPADELAEFKGLEVVWRGTKLHNSERLKDFIDAPELFEAYPELRNVAVRFDDLGDNVFGQYSAARNEITINPNHKEVAIKSALAHEIQHAIQHIEGFAKGGNTESVRTKAQELRRDVRPLYEMMLDTPEWAEKQRLQKRWFDETDDAKIAEIEARVEEIDNSGVLKGIEALQAELQKKYGLDRTVGRIISSPYAEDAEIWNELPDSFNDRFEAYRSLAGEVEARNVQSRMGMTEEERRNSLAVETEDVAREDQVFIEENLGVSASEGKESLPKMETGKENEQYADGSEFIVRGTDLSDGPVREPGEPEWKFKARREKWRRWVNSFVSTKDPVPEKPFQGADETDEEYRERLKAFNKGLKEWKKQVTKTDAGIDEMMEALYNGKSPEQTPEEEFTENVFRRYMGRDGGIEISKKGMRGIIRDEIIERRRLIETNNFEDVLFVNKVKDATTPEERKIIPFIIEGTYNGEVSPELAAVVKSVKDWFETVYQMLQAADAMHSSGKIKNYVTHIWDKERTPKKVYENYINTRSKYTNKRSIETYAEGIALGMVPKYDDVCDIMLEYGHIANEAVANKKFIDFLHELTVDGEPVLIDAKKSNPLYKKTTSEALEGYRVHKYVSGIVNTVLGSVRTPDVPEWASGIAHFYDIAGAFMKKVNLSLSFFHHGALIETAVGAMNPIKAGSTLFKNIIWDSIRTGKAPALANPEAARRAVNHLVQLGATSDYLAKDVQRLTGQLKKFAEELRDKNPNMLTDGAENVATFIDFLNYGFDEVLWTYLHDGLKIYAFDKYAKEIDEYCAKKGLDETDKDMLLNEAGQFVNDTFGGQFWELLDISPAMQKWLRRGLLSPDWTLSTIRQALSPFGFGTLYKDYEDKWYQRLFGGRGDKTDKSALGRLMNMSEGVKLRRRLGVSFWTMAALTFIPAMNLLNAWRRADDEEEELKKAIEKRKVDPNYKSPYELKYPNGMKWYDYTMVGNTLGHKTHLFGGRYDDGKEMYIRWGKQFRELPELFLGKDGFVFPGPMIDKLVGKVNPAAHAVLDFAGFSKDGWENVYMKDKIGWEKELGRVMSLVVRCMPYSIPFDEDKEFALTDLMMPSSKGYSRYKALQHFEEAIKSQDMDFVGEVYNACVINKLDAEKLLKAALSRVEAEAKSEYVEGVETLNDAFEAYPVSDVERKRSIRKKMLRLLEENRYKDFERADAEELVLKALSGDGDKASVSLPDVYLRMETPADVVDDYKIKAIKMALAKVYKEWKGIEDIGAKAEYERKHIKQLGLRDELNEVDRKIAEQKRAMSENTKYADAYMNIIRETRRMFIERADNLGETVSQME